MLIGIDLGTTNSLVACYKDGEATLIPNRLGEFLTPSVVSIDDEGNLFVGQVAKERIITDPDKTAQIFKRSIGTNKEFLLGRKGFSATELSALVLRSLKEDAEIFLGEEVTEAIISVPAYFNDVQRKATKQAGEMAGLKVERIINEPTAAAIAYGIRLGDEERRVLVFDLGGGTFDVSILELDGDIMEVQAIAGDNYLGGEDFTNVIYKLFFEENNIDENALSATVRKHVWRQAELCKMGFSDGSVSAMNCNLSAGESGIGGSRGGSGQAGADACGGSGQAGADARGGSGQGGADARGESRQAGADACGGSGQGGADARGGSGQGGIRGGSGQAGADAEESRQAGGQIRWELSAEKFEKACEDLMEKLKKPIERSLKDAKLKVADLDDIILVGGGTRLPLVRSFVTRIFRRFPNVSVNPDEAVALGAAIQCGMKERNEDIKEIVLTDVCPFTLGTSVVRSFGDDKKEGGYFLPIIERNTVIPVSRRETLYTVRDKQTEISVDILQGESRLAKNNLFLGEVKVRVPAAPAGAESINVTYTYDINSILEVIVKVNSTGFTKKMIIKGENSGLSDEEAEARMKALDYLKVHPRDQEVNKLILARGERIYEESTGYIREELAEILARFEYILDRQDFEEIRKAQLDVIEILDDLEGK